VHDATLARNCVTVPHGHALTFAEVFIPTTDKATAS
jgi:hypothetical protein